MCHNVLVHPPGGLVGGNTLDIAVTGNGGAHGLITPPGATRCYRSSGEPALQRTHITLKDRARLEWLPPEAICYNNGLAESHLTLNLPPQAEFMGWNLTALGLPPPGKRLRRGFFAAHRDGRRVA